MNVYVAVCVLNVPICLMMIVMRVGCSSRCVVGEKVRCKVIKQDLVFCFFFLFFAGFAFPEMIKRGLAFFICPLRQSALLNQGSAHAPHA